MPKDQTTDDDDMIEWAIEILENDGPAARELKEVVSKAMASDPDAMYRALFHLCGLISIFAQSKAQIHRMDSDCDHSAADAAFLDVIADYATLIATFSSALLGVSEEQFEVETLLARVLATRVWDEQTFLAMPVGGVSH